MKIAVPRTSDHDEQLQRVKDLVLRAGTLEFRILANEVDDAEGIKAARSVFEDKANKQNLETSARKGLPPLPPRSLDGKGFEVRLQNGTTAKANYSWVELGREERQTLSLDNSKELESGPQSEPWRQAQRARRDDLPLMLDIQTLLYSRNCVNRYLSPEERASKKYDYFLLTRDSPEGQAVTGLYLVNAKAAVNHMAMPCVSFAFNKQGSKLIYDLTNANRPDEARRLFRHLAVILDGRVVIAPRLYEAIRNEGQINGNFTKQQVEGIVDILNAGALPATLKPLPVSQVTVEK